LIEGAPKEENKKNTQKTKEKKEDKSDLKKHHSKSKTSDRKVTATGDENMNPLVKKKDTNTEKIKQDIIENKSISSGVVLSNVPLNNSSSVNDSKFKSTQNISVITLEPIGDDLSSDGYMSNDDPDEQVPIARTKTSLENSTQQQPLEREPDCSSPSVHPLRAVSQTEMSTIVSVDVDKKGSTGIADSCNPNDSVAKETTKKRKLPQTSQKTAAKKAKSCNSTDKADEGSSSICESNPTAYESDTASSGDRDMASTDSFKLIQFRKCRVNIWGEESLNKNQRFPPIQLQLVRERTDEENGGGDRLPETTSSPFGSLMISQGVAEDQRLNQSHNVASTSSRDDISANHMSEPADQSSTSMWTFCNLCNVDFDTDDALVVHVQAVHKDNPPPEREKLFRCRTCDKIYWTYNRLCCHIFARHRPSIG